MTGSYKEGPFELESEDSKKFCAWVEYLGFQG